MEKLEILQAALTYIEDNLTNNIHTEDIAEKIREKNGGPIRFEDREIPIFLYIAITTLDVKPLRYSELFSKLHLILKDAKLS